jgi:hypothetical protein
LLCTLEAYWYVEVALAKRDLDRKLCSLLVDGNIHAGDGLNKYRTNLYRYQKLRKRNPQAIFTLERQFRILLEDGKMLLDQF